MTRALRSALVCVLGVALALQASPVRAAPDAEALVVQAEEALGEGKHSEAAILFEQAYKSLSARERTGELGEHLVLTAAEAHEKAWLDSDDLAELETASKLLGKHVATVEARKQIVSPEVVNTRDRLDAILAKLGGDPSATDPSGSDPSDPSDRSDPGDAGDLRDAFDDSTSTPRDDRGERGRPDGLSLGLVIGGTVGIVGGAAMLGVGAALPGWAQGALDDRGGMSDQDAAFLDDADGLSVGLMAGGGVLTGVGVVAVVIGAVRWARRKKGSRAARGGAHTVVLQPVVTRGYSGLTIGGRW